MTTYNHQTKPLPSLVLDNELSSTAVNRGLSAAQGKILKDQIDNLDPINNFLGELEAGTFDGSTLPVATRGKYYTFSSAGTITLDSVSTSVTAGDRLYCNTTTTATGQEDRWARLLQNSANNTEEIEVIDIQAEVASSEFIPYTPSGYSGLPNFAWRPASVVPSSELDSLDQPMYRLSSVSNSTVDLVDVDIAPSFYGGATTVQVAFEVSKNTGNITLIGYQASLPYTPPLPGDVLKVDTDLGAITELNNTAGLFDFPSFAIADGGTTWVVSGEVTKTLQNVISLGIGLVPGGGSFSTSSSHLVSDVKTFAVGSAYATLADELTYDLTQYRGPKDVALLVSSSPYTLAGTELSPLKLAPGTAVATRLGDDWFVSAPTEVPEPFAEVDLVKVFPVPGPYDKDLETDTLALPSFFRGPAEAVEAVERDSQGLHLLEYRSKSVVNVNPTDVPGFYLDLVAELEADVDYRFSMEILKATGSAQIFFGADKVSYLDYNILTIDLETGVVSYLPHGTGNRYGLEDAAVDDLGDTWRLRAEIRRSPSNTDAEFFFIPCLTSLGPTNAASVKAARPKIYAPDLPYREVGPTSTYDLDQYNGSAKLVNFVTEVPTRLTSGAGIDTTIPAGTSVLTRLSDTWAIPDDGKEVELLSIFDPLEGVPLTNYIGVGNVIWGSGTLTVSEQEDSLGYPMFRLEDTDNAVDDVASADLGQYLLAGETGQITIEVSKASTLVRIALHGDTPGVNYTWVDFNPSTGVIDASNIFAGVVLNYVENLTITDVGDSWKLTSEVLRSKFAPKLVCTIFAGPPEDDHITGGIVITSGVKVLRERSPYDQVPRLDLKDLRSTPKVLMVSCQRPFQIAKIDGSLVDMPKGTAALTYSQDKGWDLPSSGLADVVTPTSSYDREILLSKLPFKLWSGNEVVGPTPYQTTDVDSLGNSMWRYEANKRSSAEAYSFNLVDYIPAGTDAVAGFEVLKSSASDGEFFTIIMGELGAGTYDQAHFNTSSGGTAAALISAPGGGTSTGLPSWTVLDGGDTWIVRGPVDVPAGVTNFGFELVLESTLGGPVFRDFTFSSVRIHATGTLYNSLTRSLQYDLRSYTGDKDILVVSGGSPYLVQGLEEGEISRNSGASTFTRVGSEWFSPSETAVAGNTLQRPLGDATLIAVNDSGKGSPGASYIILPDADITLPDISSMDSSLGFYRVRVSTDWATRAVTDPAPQWITTESSSLVLGSGFPTTGNSFVELIANQIANSWILVK